MSLQNVVKWTPAGFDLFRDDFGIVKKEHRVRKEFLELILCEWLDRDILGGFYIRNNKVGSVYHIHACLN